MGTSWFKRLRWVAGPVGTLLLAGAQVSPTQATSNYAAWFSFAGRWIGIALLLVFATEIFMGWRSRLHKERAASKAKAASDKEIAERATTEVLSPRMPQGGGAYFGRGSDSTFKDIHSFNCEVVMEDLTRCQVENVTSTYVAPPTESKKKGQ